MGRVLIVDDDESLRMALHEFLQDKGYPCEEVENGAQALEWVRTHDIDLVITDNTMPVMNGIDFLKALPTFLSCTHTPPVIFMTGNSSKMLEKEARQAGAYMILFKPYDPNELLMAVKQALDIKMQKKHCVSA